ncbi:DUF305 domain-containing protein [Sphingorhabdus sp.]|uniref:DUF305 domain-containing protein n=1 Tax=Sphingorhabdus sp. TaxID=1902408 RepID=UPI0039839BA1
MKFYRIAAAVLTLSSPVLAQQAPVPPMDHNKMQTSDKAPVPPMNHSKMDHSEMTMEHSDMMAMMNDPNNPYGATEMEMHKKMMMAKSGLPSELWTRKMIEHHRGAIAMSRVALEKATDKQTRKMAQMTIIAQTREIVQMQAWLKSHGKTSQ